ncbi:hypothetical protein A2U01_0100992 [Trifolium medium]|uniref:Uncharacterized protein n=1 Tax=Trifolium medium TaxID=97028 RepID=A0A392UXV3_9FABA|nr:hypothetical protein [Trifolium medium]
MKKSEGFGYIYRCGSCAGATIAAHHKSYITGVDLHQTASILPSQIKSGLSDQSNGQI